MESDAFSFKIDALSFKSDLAIIVRCCIFLKLTSSKKMQKYMQNICDFIWLHIVLSFTFRKICCSQCIAILFFLTASFLLTTASLRKKLLDCWKLPRHVSVLPAPLLDIKLSWQTCYSGRSTECLKLLLKLVRLSL